MLLEEHAPNLDRAPDVTSEGSVVWDFETPPQGMNLSHNFLITGKKEWVMLSEVTSCFQSLSVRLEKLKFQRFGEENVSMTFVVSRIGSVKARQLASDFRGIEAVTSCVIEHTISRRT